MRKLTMAVMAVAGLSLVAGCREGVKEERQDVAEARQEQMQERQEMQQEIAGERQEGQQEIAEQRQDVQEERQEVAEARQEPMQEPMQEPQEGTGGSAMAGAQSVNGRIQSATPDAVVLIIPEQNNQQMRLSADQQTQVKKNDQKATLKDLRPGDEIRASYEMGQNGQLILRSVEVQRSAADTTKK